MKHRPVFTLCLTALFAAAILLTTAYLMHIPVGTGYIHLGDAFIFLAACFLPAPYAMAAAAIGAAGADVLTNWVVWAPYTLVIKALMALPFRNTTRLLPVRNIMAAGVAGVINTAGYYLAGVIMTSSWISPLEALPGSFIQSGGSIVLFLFIAAALDKAHIKSRLGRRAL